MRLRFGFLGFSPRLLEQLAAWTCFHECKNFGWQDLPRSPHQPEFGHERPQPPELGPFLWGRAVTKLPAFCADNFDHEDEAERVRLIYRRYLELSGVNALVRDLKDKEIRTKIRLRVTICTG
jgi:hypothetical protein